MPGHDVIAFLIYLLVLCTPLCCKPVFVGPSVHANITHVTPPYQTLPGLWFRCPPKIAKPPMIAYFGGFGLFQLSKFYTAHHHHTPLHQFLAKSVHGCLKICSAGETNEMHRHKRKQFFATPSARNLEIKKVVLNLDDKIAQLPKQPKSQVSDTQLFFKMTSKRPKSVLRVRETDSNAPQNALFEPFLETRSGPFGGHRG